MSQGAANAGASSSAEDISNMYFNPASIAYHSGINVSAGMSVIFSNADMNNATGDAFPPFTGDATSDETAFVPSGYVSAQLSDTVYVGVGVAAPFGLVTDYGDEWAGRYHATYSELTTINISPTIAYRPIPELAIAGGPVIEYADADLRAAIPVAPLTDSTAKFTGDDIAFGWTLGAILEPVDGTRLGVGFRSEITHSVDLDGNIGVADVPSKTTVSAPAQLNFGVTQTLTDDWTVMAEAQWTQWSSFDQLLIESSAGTPLSLTTTKWDDTWFFSLGARYQATEDLALRFGAAYDTGAAPADHRTPRIPDADRIWGALGATYNLTENVSLSGAYTYVYVEDSTIDLDGTDPENAAKGSLTADVDSDVHILTIGTTFKF